jgi:hypothetical protein
MAKALTPSESQAVGKTARRRTPRSSHGVWEPPWYERLDVQALEQYRSQVSRSQARNFFREVRDLDPDRVALTRTG